MHAVGSDPSLLIGRVFGSYRILDQIGAGGMGVVFRARDEQLERDVAVKVLPAGLLKDDAARKRFRREALALSRLNHRQLHGCANSSRVFASLLHKAKRRRSWAK